MTAYQKFKHEVLHPSPKVLERKYYNDYAKLSSVWNDSIEDLVNTCINKYGESSVVYVSHNEPVSVNAIRNARLVIRRSTNIPIKGNIYTTPCNVLFLNENETLSKLK